jgi:hypothetical protein
MADGFGLDIKRASDIVKQKDKTLNFKLLPDKEGVLIDKFVLSGGKFNIKVLDGSFEVVISFEEFLIVSVKFFELGVFFVAADDFVAWLHWFLEGM